MRIATNIDPVMFNPSGAIAHQQIVVGGTPSAPVQRRPKNRYDFSLRSGIFGWPTRVLLIALLTVALCAIPVFAIDLEGDFIDGRDHRCTDFSLTNGLFGLDIPDPGWILIRRSDPTVPLFRSAVGVVTRSKVTHRL